MAIPSATNRASASARSIRGSFPAGAGKLHKQCSVAKESSPFVILLTEGRTPDCPDEIEKVRGKSGNFVHLIDCAPRLFLKSTDDPPERGNSKARMPFPLPVGLLQIANFESRLPKVQSEPRRSSSQMQLLSRDSGCSTDSVTQSRKDHRPKISSKIRARNLLRNHRVYARATFRVVIGGA